MELGRPWGWITAAAFAVLSLYLAVALREVKQKRPYLDSDARAIELAKQAFMRETGGDRASIMGSRFPMVIRFGDVRCVSLKVRRGWLGKTPTYCFDMDYRRVTTVTVPDYRTPDVLDLREISKQPPITD